MRNRNEKRMLVYPNKVKLRTNNKRVLVSKSPEDEYFIGFKTIVKEYHGIEQFVHHKLHKDKLAVNYLKLSHFGAEALMVGLAHILGYEIVKKS